MKQYKVVFGGFFECSVVIEAKDEDEAYWKAKDLDFSEPVLQLDYCEIDSEIPPEQPSLVRREK